MRKVKVGGIESDFVAYLVVDGGFLVFVILRFHLCSRFL